jgi:hypothetical protein
VSGRRRPVAGGVNARLEGHDGRLSAPASLRYGAYHERVRPERAIEIHITTQKIDHDDARERRRHVPARQSGARDVRGHDDAGIRAGTVHVGIAAVSFVLRQDDPRGSDWTIAAHAGVWYAKAQA